MCARAAQGVRTTLPWRRIRREVSFILVLPSYPARCNFSLHRTRGCRTRGPWAGCDVDNVRSRCEGPPRPE